MEPKASDQRLGTQWHCRVSGGRFGLGSPEHGLGDLGGHGAVGPNGGSDRGAHITIGLQNASPQTRFYMQSKV